MAFGVGKIAASLPAGIFMDRLGRQRLMAMGLALVAAVDALSALELAFARFLLWRALAGFGFGLFVTTAATSVLDLAPAARRSRSMGSYLLVGDLGAVVGAAAGGWIYERLGAQIFFAKTLLAAIAATLAGRASVRAGAGPSVSLSAPGRALRLPGLLPLAALNMILFSADVAAVAFLFPLFLSDRGVTPGTIGVLVSLVVTSQLVSLVLGSRAADRWGRVTMLAAGLALYAAGALLLATGPPIKALVAAAVLVGVGSGMARGIPPALVGDIADPPSRSSAMATFRGFTDLGMIAGPAVLGIVARGSGYETAFFAVAGLLVLALGLLIPISRQSGMLSYAQR
jgi:MFS family permease